MSKKNLAIVGDIGGTNARFATVKPGSTELQDIEVLPCSDYPNLDGAFADYVSRHDLQGVKEASIAFACPVHTDTIKMTNNHWVFSKTAVKKSLGLEVFKCINDFTAMALGVPHIAADQLVRVGGGEGDPHRPRLVIGPGTGLGVSGLVKSANAWIPMSTEGGHVDFAPTNELEIKVLQYLLAKYKRVSVERLLCGEGLVNTYRALAAINGQEVKFGSPAGITHAAFEDQDELSLETMRLFCKVFGQVCGNAALTIGALGGVYVCGGIIPRFIDFFVASEFRQQFDAKGRMQGYMEAIPAFVVKEKFTGLLGAAEAVTNQEV